MTTQTDNKVLDNLRDLGAAVAVLWEDLCRLIARLTWKKMILMCALALIIVPIFALPSFFILLICIAFGIKLSMPKNGQAVVEHGDANVESKSEAGTEEERSAKSS